MRNLATGNLTGAAMELAPASSLNESRLMDVVCCIYPMLRYQLATPLMHLATII